MKAFIIKDQLKHAYYDEKGKKVKDMSRFSGVLYMYDENHELQPVRRVARLDPPKSSTTIDQRSGRQVANGVSYSDHYLKDQSSESFRSMDMAKPSKNMPKPGGARKSVYFTAE
ncbi:hypothetical protein EB796_008791 [Bugula neritina]|uniref:Uncharacterized protein n=1 Tax=Bugula neritina TaxID=10212 RepID=A0A7J7K5P3_BUGNE|nr:hypothetical protein EB796_008791 [Bugula neritina]